MLTRFLFTLMSAWIVNPLAVLLAQSFGVANTPVVILVLLAIGACAPFQLLFNECVATAESLGRSRTSWVQRGLLLAIQSVACAIAIGGLAIQNFSILLIFIIVVLLAANTALSLQISSRYFHLVTRSTLSIRDSVIVGVIPGLTCLLLYSFYCFVELDFSLIGTVLIIASTVFPAITQWGYLQSRSSLYIDFNEFSHKKETYKPPTGHLLTAAVALTLLTIVATRQRETIALLSDDYIALFLVALNSIFGLIITVTRATFLNRSKKSKTKLFVTSLFILAVASVGSFVLGWWVTSLFALLASQLAIVWVIDLTRSALIHPEFLSECKKF